MDVTEAVMNTRIGGKHVEGRCMVDVPPFPPDVEERIRILFEEVTKKVLARFPRVQVSNFISTGPQVRYRFVLSLAFDMSGGDPDEPEGVILDFMSVRILALREAFAGRSIPGNPNQWGVAFSLREANGEEIAVLDPRALPVDDFSEDFRGALVSYVDLVRDFTAENERILFEKLQFADLLSRQDDPP